jgi:hypothetical protein
LCSKLMYMQKLIIVNSDAKEVIRKVREAIAKSPTGVTFFSIKNYRNNKNELSHYSINLGSNYAKMKQRDIEFLENLDVTQYRWKSSMVDIMKAKTDVLESLRNPSAIISKAQTDAYESIIGNSLKVHKGTGELYVYGYLKSKKVLEAGQYDADSRRPSTIAKDEIRKLLRTGKFRMFNLTVDNELVCNGKTLTIDFQPKAVILNAEIV